MNRVTQFDFSRLPAPSVQRSYHNLSHGYQTTFDHGYLIPVYCEPILPGDTFSISPKVFIRMTPTVVPIMDNLFFDLHFFWVPMELIWTSQQPPDGYGASAFFGERPNVASNVLPVSLPPPTIVAPAGGWLAGSIEDYFGLQINLTGLVCCSLPLRAYNSIYNNWYRDQNCIDPVYSQTTHATVDDDDGTVFVLLKRAKPHDYFTSATPWPQRGPDVQLPIGDSAPVFGNQYSMAIRGYDGVDNLTTASLRTGSTPIIPSIITTSPAGLPVGTGDTSSGTTILSQYGVGYVSKDALDADAAPSAADYAKSGLYADLTEATAVSINDLREAIAMQQFYETDGRYGTRYPEFVRAHYGVVCPDLGFRPEFLGSISGNIVVNPVYQTAPNMSSGSSESDGVGDMHGVGTGFSQGFALQKSFTQHGYIIGILSTRQDERYAQGVARHWFYETREEWGIPTLAHMGPQPIYDREIYCDSNWAAGGIFGYTDRYQEFRHHNSLVTGLFRPQAPLSLSKWNLCQNFTSTPDINAAFIEVNDNVMTNRVVYSSEPHFYCDIYYEIKAGRPLPVYGIPGLNRL